MACTSWRQLSWSNLMVAGYQYLGSLHTYNTRTRNKLAVQRHCTGLYYKEQSSAGTKFMKKDPRDLLVINNSAILKEIKQYLI